MALKKDHKGIDELTDAEADELARELFDKQCEEARETETPPEYEDGSRPVAARIIADLDDDIDEVLGDAEED